MSAKPHKAGFVNIIGKPNVGKSTLMNAFLGEKLSVATYKAQTTRHRIMGILNDDDYQIVYSDTPGIIKPAYALQTSMMRYVKAAMDDADVILYMVTAGESTKDNTIWKQLEDLNIPTILVINKVDKSDQKVIEEQIDEWKQLRFLRSILPVSAKELFNLEIVMEDLLSLLPAHPPYFPKDELSDKTMRFFASEILRGQIMLNYEKEVPYACDVRITDFLEREDLFKIRAEIIVERDSQKGIIIGQQGKALKKVGTGARKEMEAFMGKKIFLETHVKVIKDWRKDEFKLKKLGYGA